MKKINAVFTQFPTPLGENKLQEHRCVQKMFSFLPKVYQNNIRFGYIRGKTLYIVTKHQALNVELFHKLREIQGFLSLIKAKTTLCKGVEITAIRTFSKFEKKVELQTYKWYIKPVNNFENQAKNPKIYKKFEEIKEILRARED